MSSPLDSAAADRDALLAKTDAQLLYFAQHPDLYPENLVELAWRELRRRGVHLPAGADPDAPVSPFPAEAEPEPRKRPVLLVAALGAGVLAAVGIGLWGKNAASAPPPAAAAGHLSPDSLRLETAPTHALPVFDTEAFVEREFKLIPAAEKTNPQRVRQFRELTRRFWTAQNPTAYLVAQADTVTDLYRPVFAGHLNTAQGYWRELNKGLVYRYDFGPVMADHLDRIRFIAQRQRRTLDELSPDYALRQTPGQAHRDPLRSQDSVRRLLGRLQHAAGPRVVHL